MFDGESLLEMDVTRTWPKNARLKNGNSGVLSDVQGVKQHLVRNKFCIKIELNWKYYFITDNMIS
jgi:hypothetical protein